MSEDDGVTGGVFDGERVMYVVDKDIVERDEAITACAAVLELRGRSASNSKTKPVRILAASTTAVTRLVRS